MDAHAPKASLDGLPPELLAIIFPDPSSYPHVNVTDLGTKIQRWLAFKSDWSDWPHDNPSLGVAKEDNPQEALQTLRALSQTCQRLRAFTLPLLWTVVHVNTVRELGILRDVLRSTPSIASLIRHFSFFWDMNGDSRKCNFYLEENGSLLDMAFIDRGELWERTQRQLGCKVRVEAAHTPDGPTYPYYRRAGALYHEPGTDPGTSYACEPEVDYFSDEGGMPRRVIKYSQRGPNIHRCGPDGRGPDPRISNDAQLITCLAEVASSLVALQAFIWRCDVISIPPAVCQALEKANLSTLHVTMSIGHGERSPLYAVPLWRMTSRLESLSVIYDPVRPNRLGWHHSEVSEMSAEDITSFELLPLSLFSLTEDSGIEIHHGVSCRTIVTAAQGGRLRRLAVTAFGVQEPFAVRSLLPCWVKMDVWEDYDLFVLPGDDWVASAWSLRPTLAHASMWLPESSPGARDDRRLTCSDVRSLLGHFECAGVPAGMEPKFDYDEPDYRFSSLYLPWLAEDIELAQQVADAWNAVVARGEADVVKCGCEKCRALLNPPSVENGAEA